jgi:hypothetical protein
VYHDAVLALLLAVSLAAAPVERVLAVVNGVPVLETDVELAEIGDLAPRAAGEDDAAYERAVVETLIDLELRWQDLKAAGIPDRTEVDIDGAWHAVAERVGGEAALRASLATAGLDEPTLRYLLYRVEVVKAYVNTRFAPFVRPTEAEVEEAWKERFAPQLRARGEPAPNLAAVHDKIVAILREEKLLAEIQRWTEDLARRAEIVRYLG